MKKVKVKKVFKYGTGDVIPENAVYLSTVTETVQENVTTDDNKKVVVTRNLFVWHYFLTEVDI